MLSVAAIELGPSDNIALDQPRVAVELLSDVNPDPAIEQWESVGPSIFNTFLLDTGANSVLAMATAVSDMSQPPLAYGTEGEFVEVGVGGDHPMDVSASYRFDFAGTSGVRNTLHETRVLSDADNDFSMFGPWGLVGMPAMAERVTSMDMRGWSGGGLGLDDLYMKVAFSDELPGDEGHRYALSVDNRLAFDPLDYLVSGEPPVWADIPFLTAIPTQDGVGAEGTFLFDTGAQISLISEHLAIAIGLDSNGDGLLDQNDSAYLGSEAVGGVGGQTSVPVFAIDELRVPVTQVSSGEVVELVWTDLQWLVLDIQVAEGEAPLDGVFGSDLLTSGWFYSFFYPGMPDGYINQVHLDFRDWGLYDGSMQQRSGTIYFDLNPAVDQVILPGPGIRLQETARSTEVIKGVSTDTYTLALETVPLAPVEITITADSRTLVSADGGATFASTLALSLNDRTPRTITVAAVDDGLIEGPQTGRIGHTVASDDPDYDNLPVRDVTVRILDNRSVVMMTADQAGQQAITSIEVAEGEQATYWIQLSEPAANEMWVLIEDSSGQAAVVNPNNTMGDGFENVWMFSSGNWSQPQPVRLTAVDDTLREGPHQTQLVHTLLDLASLLDPIVGENLLTVQIIDNDLGGVVITETAGGTQLAEGGATGAYQIALATMPAGAVQIAVTADSQTEVSADGGLTFASTLVLTLNDTAAQTIAVRAVDDDVDEGTHSGRITHAIADTIHDPMYPASLPIAHVTAAIGDNDTAGISISDDPLGQNTIASISVVEGDQVRYWTRLTSQPRHDVTIYLDSTNGQVTAVDDAHTANAFLQFTPANWNVPQAVRASAIDDSLAEGAHTDYLAHDFFSSDSKYQGTILLTVSIADPPANAVPLLASLSATPSPITRPGQLTLVADGVSDADGAVARVEFYRGEELLGVDEDGSDGWSISVATGGWAVGEHSFSARAEDNDAAWSEWATVTAIVADADLETVDFSTLESLDLSAGSVYYGFSTAHTGLLTLEVVAPSPPKSARIRLYAENPQESTAAVPLAASALVDGNQRIDWSVQAGQDYYVEFYGANPQFDARIANLVHQEGTTVSVHGTELDDSFAFDAGNSRNLTINGVKYAFADEEVALVQFAGGAGYNTVVLRDSPGDDHFDAWSDRATFGNNPDDGAEVFLVNVSEFAEIHAYATAGGHNTAALYDHPQGEESSKNNKAKAEPALGHVKLYGGGPYTRVKLFDVVDIYSSGGDDLARLFGSEGDDTFEGQMGLSRLSGPGYDVRVHGFERVIADARQAGTDIARLVDSALKDEFHGKPHKSELFDQVTGGDVYKITARGFAEVHAEASNREGQQADGGRDKAALWDTARDDLVRASGDQLRFYQERGELRLLYELLAFETVKVRESSGGNDRAEQTLPLDFLLEFDDGWDV